MISARKMMLRNAYFNLLGEEPSKKLTCSQMNEKLVDKLDELFKGDTSEYSAKGIATELLASKYPTHFSDYKLSSCTRIVKKYDLTRTSFEISGNGNFYNLTITFKDCNYGIYETKYNRTFFILDRKCD